MKKRIFYTELAYVLGLIILAFAAALLEKTDFGVSMIVAPAYILHLKLSQFFPWFTFGVAEYCFQGLLVLVTIVIMRKLKLSYLFSFITAILYGTVLDCAMCVVALLPDGGFFLRSVWYLLGILLSTFAISLFFHTYLAPEAYELIVKEIASKTKRDINKVKIIYDYFSVVLSIAMSFLFFGFGVFEGIKPGTILGALVNGFLIAFFSKQLERVFEFKDKLNLKRFFE